MTLVRTFDPALVNRIANHPEVLPGTLAHKELDISSAVLDGRNVCLFDELGGFVFAWKAPRHYEVHTIFTPEGRGRHVLEAALAALQFMFTQTDCALVETFCAKDNRAAIWLTLRCGFEKDKDTMVLGYVGTRYYLSIKRWVTEVLCL